ncbi:thiol reductant ABC exporter subunit CydD [Coralloluteibacterium stylophorae]|uniref:Thiol reductant ABC exporter subunit CydD n=1 Tax=Coralloluteibacterium stylophorae TaxID=1776034 RepID=A0A8J7VV88_9GAMM|nr:thiol reductant ABC exporter subunit CydD [Coralloluteibacterium stylophorae]MBS7455697.1 thiol reductant ABC exporter subunit CydD [Coralloluteibacterium stylophorae]
MTEPEPNPATDADARRRRQQWLDALGRGERGRLRLAAGAATLSGWLLVGQAAAIAVAVQAVVVEGRAPEALLPAFAALAVVLLARAALGWLAQEAAGSASERIRLRLRGQVYRHLLRAGPLWLRRRRGGELAELMLTHTDALDAYYAGYLPVRTEVVAVPLGILAAVFFADWIVGLVLLVTAPLVPLFMMLVGWGAEAAGREQLDELGRMSGHFADRLKGLGLIRVYGRAREELAGIATAVEGLRVRTLKVLRIAFLSSAVLEFFASVSVAVVALYFGLGYLDLVHLRDAVPTLGTGVFCLLLAPEFFAPLRRLAAHYHDRAGALAAAAALEARLGGLPDPDATAAPVAGAGPRGEAPAVVAEALCLRPQGARRPVLEGLDFVLPAGGRLALIGPSGCGKSTLLDALAGWLPAEGGRLVLPVQARVGHAGQRPYLFPGSIADNLRLARPQATRAELEAAAEAAQVMRFAARLPQGLDTVIGERGFGLSGGEARRVGLARIFLRDPALVLLDEPTAFLDPATEADLLDALARFLRGRTLVMATHSAAATRLADCVLRLPEGRLLCDAPAVADDLETAR